MNQKEKEKILKVIISIDNCIGISIPLPLAKKMVDLSTSLKDWIESKLETHNEFGERI